MKTILFGIALILFGLMCVYVSVQAQWGVTAIIGLLSGVLGLIFSIIGFCDKEQ